MALSMVEVKDKMYNILRHTALWKSSFYNPHNVREICLYGQYSGGTLML